MTLPMEFRGGFLEMIRELKPEIAVTLNTYPGLNLVELGMSSSLKRLEARVASVALGRRWHRKDHSSRLSGVFVLEFGRGAVNPHWQ